MFKMDTLLSNPLFYRLVVILLNPNKGEKKKKTYKANKLKTM